MHLCVCRQLQFSFCVLMCVYILYMIEKASELTEMGKGKHHIGDFLPPKEQEKFVETVKAVKEDRDPGDYIIQAELSPNFSTLQIKSHTYIFFRFFRL